MTALPNSVKSRFHFSWILHLENMDIFYESALSPEMFSFAAQKRTRKAPAISTRWIRRVAAPCVCFVPWAALASCRPLPQQLLPVSAAGGGRRRCTFFRASPIDRPLSRCGGSSPQGSGCALSVTFGDTLSPFCRCATSSPDRGKSFKGRGKKHSQYALGTLSKKRQETLPPRSWLSLRESWREAPERARSPAGRDRRKIKIIFPLNIAQSEAEGILNPVFVVLKSQNPEKPAQKRLKAVQKRFWMCYTNK